MKSHGEQIVDELVVAKVLRNLTPEYKHVATEKAQRFSDYLSDELMSSLQAHQDKAAEVTRERLWRRGKHFR